MAEATTTLNSEQIPVEIIGEEEQGENAFNMKTYVKNYLHNGKSVHLVETHFWKGRTLTNYPTLSPISYALTSQAGTLPEGVKFGLVYADGFENSAAKFVVAFDCPANKVYAETGPVGPVDWDVVEVKLGMSGRVSEYDDPILGFKCRAEVTDNVNRHGHAIFHDYAGI